MPAFCRKTLQFFQDEKALILQSGVHSSSYFKGNIMEQKQNATTDSPLSDLMFDWISVLHSKGKGLEAYDKYLNDARQQNATACVELLERLQEQDKQAVAEIKEHLAQMFANQASGAQTTATNRAGTERTDRGRTH
jgi:hypothetical protein